MGRISLGIILAKGKRAVFDVLGFLICWALRLKGYST